MNYVPSEFALFRRRRRITGYVPSWLALAFWLSLATAVVTGCPG